MSWDVLFKVPANGHIKKADVELRSDGNLLFTDQANMLQEKERNRLARKISKRVGEEVEAVFAKVESQWNRIYEEAVKAGADADPEPTGPPADPAPDDLLAAMPAD